MKHIIKNKNSIFILIGAYLLIGVLSLILLFMTENYRYGLILLKVFNILIIAASLIYTYNLYNKQILVNAMFGITRKETHKKWVVKIIIIALATFLVNMLYAILDYFLILKENSFGQALLMGLTYFEGFYLYFVLNFLMFIFSALNIKNKNKKNIALTIFIIGLFLSILFSFLLGVNILQEFIMFLTVLDVFVGSGLFVLGLILILFINKVVYKGEY